MTVSAIFFEKAVSVLLHSIVAVPTAHNKKNCRITINKWQQLLKPEENLIIDNLAADETCHGEKD